MDAVDEIKGRLSIEDVIGEYVPLKRAGRNFKGLSPFTNEKTPSFIVSPEKQIWHDFSSSKGGDIFSFIMEVEGLDFKGALELLARRAGVDLDQYQRSHPTNNKLKERLYECLELATKFYQVQFSSNAAVLDYVLKQRGFSKQSALEFRLGYSPNTGLALDGFLKKKGFLARELQQAGLITQRFRGATDMFRGRLMIPLMDPQGRVIGFTARLLDDLTDAPKYINTPQTTLYDKSRHVFGLHLAKDAIRKEKFAVLVEGNLDVIASRQAGVQQVVATAGTALTSMHLKTLQRFSSDVRLAFDMDKAGQQAAERAIPIANKVGVALSIITLSSAKDPDELIKSDPAKWQQAVHSAKYALDWLIKKYQNDLDLTSAQGKKQFSDVLLPVVRQIDDSVEQDHYLTRLSEILSISKEALLTKFRQQSNPDQARKRKIKTSSTLDLTDLERAKSQDQLLGLTLMRPQLRKYLEHIMPDMLVSDSARTLLTILKENPTLEVESTLTHELQQIDNYVKIIMLQYEALYEDRDTVELIYEVTQVRSRLMKQYVKSKKVELAAAMRSADERTTQELLTQAKALDILLKSTKEN